MLAGQEDDGEGSHDEEDVEDEEEEEKREEEAKKGDAILFQKLHGSMTQQVWKDFFLSDGM